MPQAFSWLVLVQPKSRSSAATSRSLGAAGIGGGGGAEPCGDGPFETTAAFLGSVLLQLVSETAVETINARTKIAFTTPHPSSETASLAAQSPAKFEAPVRLDLAMATRQCSHPRENCLRPQCQLKQERNVLQFPSLAPSEAVDGPQHH